MKEWRVIADFPNYAVSDEGDVMRLTSRTLAKAGSLLKQSWRRGSGDQNQDRGYLTVDLCRDGNRSTISVHVLVAEAFIGTRPEGKVVNHLDGNRANNRASNLEWATQSRNVQHAYDIGLSNAKGESNGQAKLTDEKVIEMRRLATGERGDYARLARRFGMSSKQVADILKGKAWPHLLAA